MKGILLITALLALLMGCTSGGFTGSPTPSPIESPPSGGEATPASEPGGLPNPASKYCVD